MADQVRRAEDRDRETVAALWADAFAADPVIGWFLPDRTTYREKALAIFGFMFDVRHAGGEVWVKGDLAAAAWNPPGGLAAMNPSRMERWAQVGETLAADEMERIEGYGHQLAEYLPKPETWYLAVVGTRPGYQGMGNGRAVIAPVLDRADAAGQAQSLETSTPSNRDFYRRLGYEVSGEFSPAAGIQVWVMVRQPRR